MEWSKTFPNRPAESENEAGRNNHAYIPGYASESGVKAMKDQGRSSGWNRQATQNLKETSIANTVPHFREHNPN